MKIVINKCYGAYDLSPEAKTRLLSLLNIPFERKETEAYGTLFLNPETGEDLYIERTPRNSPVLIQTIEELGPEKASGEYAELKVIEIPDDVVWEIGEYDGNEWVAEVHRTWW